MSDKYLEEKNKYLYQEYKKDGIRKVAINGCYGGFGLSVEAIRLYLKKLGKEAFFYIEITNYHEEDKNEYEQTLEDLGYTLKTVPRLFSIYRKITYEEAISQSNYCRIVHVITKDLGEKIIDSKELNKYYWHDTFYEKRDDKLLIETIEEIGCKRASARLAELRIVEIPEDVDFYIDEYDGIESIHEKHRSW